jgi:hypothetical protein
MRLIRHEHQVSQPVHSRGDDAAVFLVSRRMSSRPWLCHNDRMWDGRIPVVAALASWLVLAGTSAVFGSPAIPVPPAQTPSTVCQIASDDNGAVDVTGLVATAGGYVAIDGANQDWPLYIIHLDGQCHRTLLQPYPTAALDPQDLAVDSTGTLWIADSGDPPPSSRSHIALWKVPPSGPITIYRFTYPDGPHQAQAMVLDHDGRPIFITQPASGSGPANLYEPAPGALRSGTTVPMTNVGSFTPETTGTPNKLSILGNLLVTGGANSPDNSKVVLRTYSDAYEWKVTAGNVVAAITKGTPTITPLPNETQGKSIAYTSDGKYFLTVSNVSAPTPILRYVPAGPVVPQAASSPKGPAKPGALRAWFNSLTLTDLRLILITIALISAALIGAGVMGIIKHRKSPTPTRSGPGRVGRPPTMRRPPTSVSRPLDELEAHDAVPDRQGNVYHSGEGYYPYTAAPPRRPRQ